MPERKGVDLNTLGVVLTALLAGMLLGLGGNGAGAVTVPFLTFFSGVKLLKAITANMTASVLLRSAAASLYLRNKSFANYKVVAYILAGAIPSVLLGSWVFAQTVKSLLPPKYLNITLGILLSVCSAALLASALQKRSGRQGKKLAYAQVQSRNLKQNGINSPARQYRGLRKGVYFDNSISVNDLAFNENKKYTKPFRGRGSDSAIPILLSPIMKGSLFILGVISGLLFGITSIGSGSLIISFLSLCFPEMSMQELVTIDLLQAIPVTFLGAMAEFIFIRPDLKLSAILVIVGIPGVFGGWLISRKLDTFKLKYLIAALTGVFGVVYLNKVGSSVLIFATMTLYLLFALFSFQKKKTHTQNPTYIRSESPQQTERVDLVQ